MFGPGHPQHPAPQYPAPQHPAAHRPVGYYPPPAPPPRPPKRGLSGLVIAFLVLGGGAWAAVILGGVAFVTANATADEVGPEQLGSGGTEGANVPTPSASTVLRPEGASDNSATTEGSGSPTNSGSGSESADTGNGAVAERDGDEPGSAADEGTASAPRPASEESPKPSEGANTGSSNSGSSGGGTSWWCTASSSVRVCGFAGACNYQMVFGNGSGKDRFLASQQAKRACEASARAKGASAICVVQCSPR